MPAEYKTARVGNLLIGNGHPLVLQSMCNTDTNDIEASVQQCIRIFDAGAQLVRLTTQGMREVESLSAIREKLNALGYTHPLAADVHFLPKVAVAAAAVVEKVRINPGNYTERKYEGPLHFNAGEQEKQKEEIRKRLLPLIDVCRKHNTAIRVGVNHGSLAKRILSWYGDTPQGMVESAMEFIQVFREEDFHNLVISLKSSDSRVMVFANRLLHKRMYDEGLIYPLHLGVTEAGADEDGRIKSAVGICSLLPDGIGDTIRVSLTEDPELEIPVARTMAELFPRSQNPAKLLQKEILPHPFEYRKRESIQTGIAGGSNPPLVITSSSSSVPDAEGLREAGYETLEDDVLEFHERSSDLIFYQEADPENPNLTRKFFFAPPASGNSLKKKAGIYRLIIPGEETEGKLPRALLLPAGITAAELNVIEIGEEDLLIADFPEKDCIRAGREFFRLLGEGDIRNPVILHRKYNSEYPERLMIQAAGELGSLLNDGLGEGLWIEDENPAVSVSEIREISFNILQATGTRISKTEFIACPSCGRTLFNIQETLQQVKKACSGMKGLKIAVMGCIVNGPGEMADADYGYVGAGRGKN